MNVFFFMRPFLVYVCAVNQASCLYFLTLTKCVPIK